MCAHLRKKQLFLNDTLLHTYVWSSAPHFAARRCHRDRARAKIRKTTFLKAKRLEELATEIKKQKEGSKEMQITDEDTKGKMVLDSIVEIRAEGSSVLPRGDMESGVSSQENLDVLLAASLAAEEEMEINKNVLTSEGGLDEAEDDNEEMIFPMDNIHIDPVVLASINAIGSSCSDEGEHHG
ncbi:uncharacterized protein LOC135671200 isoform X2 [Musa acuminata AAA Group]|uniref:uncharacterized protein LOC135671200 isoform X2 n=1 Tax=Musa acuminata AAA Group TaxID=214697 RepID=UPI0031D7D3BD